ncbi:Acetyl-coenzyme A carboxylase carboxyl transferase subunit beta [Modestobacter italicus]|uniref:Acetyl-coenzyme A carboxylase carboxyl transferase subunit beta n=1 Tax=Modestobacter italicus (strain DSM 44449 / CECT 9708 / BC 501) TaxID=2732864 RepID=I4ESL7_MODI5|nr:carboxyl transferase domain-containing protein [Modestobacter marinus]CCH86380.1 Acetyl-coenzyme A carboxylase carboxyl transferase subunit beta [Modestobacter marinus]
MTDRLDARGLRDLVLDPGSWRSWDTPVPPREVDDDYARDLARAAERTQQDEAVVTGAGTLRGRPVAVVAGEFGFLAGSIGVATAERLMAAVERATAEGLPLLASPVSGGTRMQEGTVAFLQMVGITAAIARHKEAGLPYLVYLRGPTFGGVLASWGSLGHVTIAEPGAAIGFLGPRVYEALYGAPFPPGVQTSENLASRGLIDGVVPPDEIADVADKALRVLAARETWHREAAVEGPVAGDGTDADDPEDGRTAWEVVTASRRPDRPGVRQLLRTAATDVVTLNGTGAGESDPGLLLALARFGGAPCVLLGQDRRGQSLSAPLGPGALREARRGMRLAAELRLPLLTLIDTPGAALSVAAEEGGLAGEIARCLQDLVMLEAPTLAVLLGQGTGGGALALVPADRVLATANGWLGPLPPEGASAIVHRTVDRAGEMAASQGVRATDLWRAGIVDRVVPERPDAADEPVEFCMRLGRVLAEELAGLLGRDDVERRRSRARRWRHLGHAGR